LCYDLRAMNPRRLMLYLMLNAAVIAALALDQYAGLVGSDPAFGTGPLSTVLQDLFSILIYLEVATLVLR